MPNSKFDPHIHHRKSIRLQGFDYSSAGAYFVTIIARGRECLFGEVVDGAVKLNRVGEIVDHAWFDLPWHYRYVLLGAFVIMPNHVHRIIVLNDNGRGGSVSGMTTLPDVTIASQTAVLAKPETRPYSMNGHYGSHYINPNGMWRAQTEMYNVAADVSPTGTQMPRTVGLAYASVVYRKMARATNEGSPLQAPQRT